MSAQAAPADPQAITISGTDIAAAAENVNGLTYKGFGILSANSTSALLLDYKAQQPGGSSELLETLYGGDYPIMNTSRRDRRQTATHRRIPTRRPWFHSVRRAARAGLPARGGCRTRRSRRCAPRPPALEPPGLGHDDQEPVHLVQKHRARRYGLGVIVDSINPDTNETGDPDVALYKVPRNWLRNDALGYEERPAATPTTASPPPTKEAYKDIRSVAADAVGARPSPSATS